MKNLALCGTLMIATNSAFAQVPELTAAETAAGWRSLFDGCCAGPWRGYKQEGFPEKGWVVENGTLRHVKGAGGGDIVSKDEYGDFELSLEFMCAPGANSGIMYRVSEKHDYPWRTGPEYQILDDALHPDGKDPKHTAGSLYDMIAPPANRPAAPADAWHTARIRVRNGVVQHYLNGVKTAECRIDNQEWKDRIGQSKFKDMAGFGMESRGRIALQDHGDDVWFRNIKVRELDAPMPGETHILNSKDLAGWTAHLDGGAKMEDVWTISDGILTCTGNPAGYLRTVADHTSFVLKLEWRFPDKPGNSGVLLRVQGPDKVWPRSIEAQLHSGSAGDFWCIDEFPMKTDPARLKGRNTKRTHTNERPLGEWNEYEIILDGTNLTLNVNGETLNSASECAVMPGKIALQSEGAPIQFRNVRLAPLK